MTKKEKASSLARNLAVIGAITCLLFPSVATYYAINIALTLNESVTTTRRNSKQLEGICKTYTKAWIDGNTNYATVELACGRGD